MRNALQNAGVLAILLSVAACASVPAPTEHSVKYTPAKVAVSPARRAPARAVQVSFESPPSPEQPAEPSPALPEPEATGAIPVEPDDAEAQRERAARLMDEQMRRWDNAAQRALGSVCRGC